MKKIFSALVIVLMMGCSNSTTHYKNPYLPDYSFSMPINLNLPLYSLLKVPVNPKIITDPQSGVTMFVMKVSDTDYRAWDVNCPNQAPVSCSAMVLDGLNAKCNCENFEYSLFTGTGSQGEYAMKPYRVEVVSADLIRVYN